MRNEVLTLPEPTGHAHGVAAAEGAPPPPPRPRRRGRSVAAAAVALVMALVVSGCFSMSQGNTFAVGTERNRANVVIYTKPSRDLTRFGHQQGSRAARSLILANTPSRLRITLAQRAVICAASMALCLSVDKIGRVAASRFKDDIRHRGDFWEALRHAGHHGRCFAWTFVPSRNLTHKGIGTSGCRRGS